MVDTTERARIEHAVRRALGPDARLVSLAPLSGGANAAMLRLDVERHGEALPLVLRRAATSDGFALDVDKRTEAAVQAAAASHGVPAAAVRFVLEPEDGLGEGYAMDRLDGETQPGRILADASTRDTLARTVGAVLAGVHRVPTHTLPPLPASTPLALRRALRATYDTFDQPSPVFEVAFRWLDANPPPERAPTLVHGDFRTGNLLVRPSGIAAVLDWELCHLGNPIEDLGFLCVTSWRFGRIGDRVGGFGDVDSLREAYLNAGGSPFTDDELTHWEVYGTLRWGVICLYQVFAHLRGAIPSIERAAIGRRVSEVELDLLRLLS